MSRSRKRSSTRSEITDDCENDADDFEISHDRGKVSRFHDTLNEVDDGYESDNVSVDDYIEEDFFSKKHFNRNLVTSKATIRSSAIKKSRHVNKDILDSAVKRSRRDNDNVLGDNNEKKEKVKTPKEIAYDELEKKRVYFKEIIDCHKLTIECDDWT